MRSTVHYNYVFFPKEFTTQFLSSSCTACICLLIQRGKLSVSAVCSHCQARAFSLIMLLTQPHTSVAYESEKVAFACMRNAISFPFLRSLQALLC